MWTQEIVNFWNNLTNKSGSAGHKWRVETSQEAGTTVLTQSQQDVGNESFSMYANNTAVGATTVETAMTMNISRGVLAVTNGVSYTIPAGKTLRIKHISFDSTGNAVGAVASTVFSVRYNAAGAVVVGSTPILYQRTLAHPAVNSDFKEVDIPNIETDIVGDGTASIGITTNATYAAGAPTVGASIVGFLFDTP